MVLWSTNANEPKVFRFSSDALFGILVRWVFVEIIFLHDPHSKCHEQPRVLSGEDNEPVALPIDQLLCCFAGQTNQRRHNLRVLSVSPLLPASNLTLTFLDLKRGLNEFLRFGPALLASSDFLLRSVRRGRIMMTLMNLGKGWAPSVFEHKENPYWSGWGLEIYAGAIVRTN